jgi:tRNA U34 5-methylaminomethyl-2-thiouridine-forming methyltransferase MnmC
LRILKNYFPFYNPTEDINNDFLERFILQGMPRETKGQDTKNNTASEFVSHKESKLKELLDNILKRDKIDKRLQGKAEATRKDLVFLSFIKFTLLMEDMKKLWKVMSLERNLQRFLKNRKKIQFKVCFILEK